MMNSQSNIYCQSMPARPEQNRQTLLLVLLSKLIVFTPRSLVVPWN